MCSRLCSCVLRSVSPVQADCVCTRCAARVAHVRCPPGCVCVSQLPAASRCRLLEVPSCAPSCCVQRTGCSAYRLRLPFFLRAPPMYTTLLVSVLLAIRLRRPPFAFVFVLAGVPAFSLLCSFFLFSLSRLVALAVWLLGPRLLFWFGFVLCFFPLSLSLFPLVVPSLAFPSLYLFVLRGTPFAFSSVV